MTTQKIKPILFSTEMVQAILAGRKTQTRRLTGLEIPNQKPSSYEFLGWDKNIAVFKSPEGKFRDCEPRYREGDILWVRETTADLRGTFRYRADNDSDLKLFTGWKPSIHMPKEAARIFLKVTNVRVERLQDISEEDAIAEGIASFNHGFGGSPRGVWYRDYKHLSHNCRPRDSFRTLWQSINGKKHPWDTNPWVWVYTFEQTEKPDNFLNNETHHTTD